jgi:hypothetical protein
LPSEERSHEQDQREKSGVPHAASVHGALSNARAAAA